MGTLKCKKWRNGALSVKNSIINTPQRSLTCCTMYALSDDQFFLFLSGAESVPNSCPKKSLTSKDPSFCFWQMLMNGEWRGGGWTTAVWSYRKCVSYFHFCTHTLPQGDPLVNLASLPHKMTAVGFPVTTSVFPHLQTREDHQEIICFLPPPPNLLWWMVIASSPLLWLSFS